ncbi:MAG: hypothetical protein M3076_00955 [Actinomycetota bacterium]|nr:hypothetical protein [Actinomycetota bacterium]
MHDLGDAFTRRSIEADGHKIAPGVRNARAVATSPATLRALPNRALVLALIGTIAIALLVLGLLNVHAVTNHFGIH